MDKLVMKEVFYLSTFLLTDDAFFFLNVYIIIYSEKDKANG